MVLTIKNAAARADRFLESCVPYSGRFSGKGIVTCGGGVKYGGCVWVLVRMLRHLGCDLPIEVWCLDEDELDPHWEEMLRPFGVTCVNAAEIRREHPHPSLGGWELKPYAILHSSFKEVLFLDADNVPVRDPSFLFESSEYQATGTIFWPDPQQFRTTEGSYLWQLFGAKFHDTPDQESGQLLVDKSRCWQALQLCNWYNQHSDFYYRHVYGDKETFRFAWQRLEQPISWVTKHATGDVLFTLQQYDFEGSVLFQHRFYRKWSLYGENPRLEGFENEEACLGFLKELQVRWEPQRHLMRTVRDIDREQMASLAGRRYLYNRPGQVRWPIGLGERGRVGEGCGPNEFFWWIERGLLFLVGVDGRRKSLLRMADGGDWKGMRLRVEKGSRRRKYRSRVQVRLQLLAS